ncbi:MAG: hypothetical protein B7733_26450 [Myxococcales bacterium FL481]|nr:MAG: hypothetical protein B7733_26450 [Myxococcales bacterium FL481]
MPPGFSNRGRATTVGSGLGVRFLRAFSAAIRRSCAESSAGRQAVVSPATAHDATSGKMTETRREDGIPMRTKKCRPGTRVTQPVDAGSGQVGTRVPPAQTPVLPRLHHCYARWRPVSLPLTTLLVANPTARTGQAERAIEEAMEGLARAGLQPEFCPTLPEGATVEALAIRIEREDIARVVYLGGDGTFAESAKGIILARERSGVDVPLGMLPMGTANDQGRSFGIMAGRRALDANIEILVEGVEQYLDAGRVFAVGSDGELLHEDLWFDSCGFGLSALILAERNRDRARVGRVPVLNRLYRDKLVYAGAGLKRFLGTMLRRWRFSCEVNVDGRVYRHQGCTDVVVKGTLLYGGDWIFAPQAKPDDGLFEVVVLHSHADWVAAAIAAHKHNPVTDDDLAAMGVRGREVPAGKEIEVRISRDDDTPLPAQIDGEEFVSCDHYRIENLFHHLRIIVPQDARWV